MVAYRAKKCATLYTTQMSVTTTVRTGYWSLHLATSLHFGLSQVFSSVKRVLAKVLFEFIISATHATCPAPLVVYLVNLAILNAVQKLWRFCLRHFVRPPAASCLTVSKVSLSTFLKDPEYLLFFQCKSSSFTCA
jgi:hypothetical protein